MSDDPTRIETASERRLEAGAAQPRAAGKGPLILAKLVVSYLTKRRQVSARARAHVSSCPVSRIMPGIRTCV